MAHEKLMFRRERKDTLNKKKIKVEHVLKAKQPDLQGNGTSVSDVYRSQNLSDACPGPLDRLDIEAQVLSLTTLEGRAIRDWQPSQGRKCM